MRRAPQMARQDIDPLWLLVILGPLGSIAGCAALLRSGQELTKRAFWNAILNSGLMSIGIGAGMIWKFGIENVWLTVSVSIFAGLGGTAAVDFALACLMQAVKKRIDSDD